LRQTAVWAAGRFVALGRIARVTELAMHYSAMRNGGRFFQTYMRDVERPVIVDVGSQDVNGSLRQLAPEGTHYVGVDFVVGKGVDVILDDPYKLPFDDDYADAVVTNSTFEHSEMFWLLFQECIRIIKPDGLLYINAPSNGVVHNYPVDCWRFYPDAGMALSRWGRRVGYNNLLLESFTAEQDGDQWNDFVAVFIKDAAHAGRYKDRILHQFQDFFNGRIDEGEMIRPAALTQDLRTISEVFNLTKPKHLNI
jgi:SAM-dependent methyltransferase